MGFLSWYERNKDKAAIQKQLDLGIEGGELSQAQHDQLVLEDRKHLTKQYTHQIQQVVGAKSGRESARTYKAANAALTETLFDCTIDDLYEATGSKRGDRDSLPPSAQQAYFQAESFACEDLKGLSAAELKAPQPQRHRRIIRGAEDSGRKAKGYSRWRDD